MKNFKIIIKNRQKGSEYYQLKVQEQIKKILTSSLSPLKCKEITSKSQQEFCIDSDFNQLIKNFNDFNILVSGKIHCREEVFLIVEV